MKKIFFLLFVFSLYSCTTGESNSVTESAIKSEILSLGGEVITALNENESGEILYRDFWQSDAALFLIDGQKVKGYSKIKEIMQQLPQMRKNVVIDPFNEEVLVLSDHMALHLVEFDETKIHLNDSITEKKGLWTTLYKKIDDAWKIVMVHESHVIQ